MTTLREHQVDADPQAGPAVAGGGNSLQARRDAADDLYRETDDLIGRALSGDSQAFNQATEQEGGQ